ncbi:MAG TPA: proton-conducting transporter membrane subunit [Gemmatimonadales bacterium]|nr:proton-conducting transporter membrane subunit [Gemmatimonadales bacterium]
MSIFLLGLATIALAGIVAVATQRHAVLSRRVVGLLTAAGCAVALVPAVRVLAGESVPAARLALPGPGGPWVFGIDPLSAAFLIVVLGPGLASALSGLYAFGAGTARGRVAAARLLFAIEIVALALVVTAQAVVPFLVAWEAMAVLAYFLVIADYDHPDVRRAGFVYLVATHAGTIALLALFAIWAGPAGGLTFADLAGKTPLWWLALLGFGLKAGLVPLHFWLPDAHASAPTHVSALMSGIVIKMGIYGLFRVVSLAAVPPAWFGWLVLGLGIVSGVLGVLWALAQHDLKRLLAYHSVENIGIILMGLGAGILGVTYHLPFIAVVGFAGALLHTLNHALFKSLLFLGAGSVAHATGTRALDQLGGLARRMPLTWIAFLVGSAAIVGLPPLNGFVSEWLVYQALLGSGAAGESIPLTLVGVVGLALVGGLALACFAKVCGIVFLGTPRTPAAEGAHEAGPGVAGPMVALAAACCVLGVVPFVAVRPALAVGAAVANATPAAAGSEVIAAPETISLLAVSLIVLLGLGVLAARAVRRRRPITRRSTWGCGYALPTARMQYTASSFAAPLLALFGGLAGVRAARTADGAAFHSHPRELVLDDALMPMWRALRAGLARLRAIQHGRLWVYLLYLIAVLLGLLLYLAGLVGTGGRP